MESDERELGGPTAHHSGHPSAWSPERSGRHRPMVAILTHYIERTEGGYEQQLRRAFVATCLKHDFDCAFISGGPLDEPAPVLSHANELYDLVTEQYFDAAILISTGLCRYVGVDQFLDRFPKLRHLAICSLGLQAQNIPSVVSDNSVGMSDAVTHLICHHGRRNLAFLGARWQDADIDCRRETFLDVMRRHGLPVPPHRILDCWLEPTSAELAVRQLLEQDSSVDGIIAANDGAALGAENAILSHGLGVPDPIAVTGYDDLPMARFSEPSITTVSQEFDALASAAVENIATQLVGTRPPQISRVPTRLVLRQSCGCAIGTSELPLQHERRAYAERLRLETMYWYILDFATSISTAPTSNELESRVVRELSKILSGDCFVGLFTEPTHQHIRPILVGRASPSSEQLRMSAQFLSSLGDFGRPRALLVLGLATASQLLGVIGFESQRYVDYATIAYHIAGAWHVTQLREEIANQQMLAERQAAAERTKATTVLASGVAHDLNNALGPLISLSEIVCDEIIEHRATGQLLNPEIIDDIQTIRTSALRATETVKDLMTLGRLGRTRHEPFDLVRLTRSLVDAQNVALAKKHARPVNFILDASDPSIHILGSEPHIERAIGNVLRNALEAASPTGEVSVVISSIRVQQRTKLRESIPPGKYAAVIIVDSGPGIPENACARIFEPFFSTKRLGESSGSGLGLAIVHSIIKEHQGYVDVTSQLGDGARFTLYIPRTDAPASAQAYGAQVMRGSGCILVVDDDLTQLRTAKRVLSRLGYEVTTLNSGDAAFDLLSKHPANCAAGDSPGSPFDVIVLDLALNGEEDGLQLFNRIRTQYPKQKGILASGHAFVDYEEQIRAANIVWLPKPYTIESLALAIQRALEQ